LQEYAKLMMRKTIIRPIVVGLLAAFLAFPAVARSRHRPAVDDGWGSSVGRNAAEAIPSGLGDQGAEWLDSMARFYADPRVDNRGYFDYYRRPHYGYARTRDRR
jgi:hypothetical protein